MDYRKPDIIFTHSRKAMEKRTKRRSANFTAQEENVLLSLVNKHKERIENKRSDAASSQLKTMTWMEIGNEFNAISDGYFRDFKVLRMKYENLKKRSKLTNTPLGEKPMFSRLYEKLPEQYETPSLSEQYESPSLSDQYERFHESFVCDTSGMDLEELKKKCFLEEHDLRLKMIQAEIRHKEQEHLKRMRILDLEEEVHRNSLDALQVQMKSEMPG